jgi:hypothetical protein
MNCTIPFYKKNIITVILLAHDRNRRIKAVDTFFKKYYTTNFFFHSDQSTKCNLYFTGTKGRPTITVDLTMEHSRNISVDQLTTSTGPCLSIVHHPG